tara:strand:- start:198 stop:629 length:432 start_codon:yes stop_codon:yes gene_type:complete
MSFVIRLSWFKYIWVGHMSLLKKLKRIIYIVFGLIFLVIGVIGYFLPGLPGTIWIIIAATLFIRSSDRLYNLVIRNRFFGHQVREFLETGKMPARAKKMALFFMWFFSFVSVVFAPYGLFFKALVLTLAAVGTMYILTRPTGQ